MDSFKGFQILGIVHILDWPLRPKHHDNMLQMKECPQAILKDKAAKFWNYGNGSLVALQELIATNPSWFKDYVIIDESSLDETLDGSFEFGGYGGVCPNAVFCPSRS